MTGNRAGEVPDKRYLATIWSIQDALLQNYRGTFMTAESILISVVFASYWDKTPTDGQGLWLFAMIVAAGIAINILWVDVTWSRGADVSFIQGLLLQAEAQDAGAKAAPVCRPLDALKEYQRRRGQLDDNASSPRNAGIARVRLNILLPCIFSSFWLAQSLVWLAASIDTHRGVSAALSALAVTATGGLMVMMCIRYFRGEVVLRMPYVALAIVGVIFALCVGTHAEAATPDQPRWAIAVHGGAGVIERKDLTPEAEAAYRAAMTHAVEKGSAILRSGGSSLDAIEAVIRDLEDDPLFNAGRGAVFTAAGRNELDASIMDGSDMRAGSVAGVTTVRHPISLARAVMEKSPHVMMIGEGAEAYARTVGMEIVPRSWFFTERRWGQLVEVLTAKGLPIPPRPTGVPPAPVAPTGGLAGIQLDDHRFGTVGVVAVDQAGHIAAGTSTGGLTAKQFGRVGDAPVIGAGTWAGRGCAVSATGTGEYFIRLSVARDVCGLLHSGRMTLQQAADAKIAEVGSIGGDGGLIALAQDGTIAFSMNTSGMYRASASSTQPARVAIFADER